METPRQKAPQDLGFGAVLGGERVTRLLNPDGSFNVVREGLSPVASLSAYHWLLTMTWPRFLSLVCAAYMLANAVFACLFAALGAGALSGVDGSFTQRWAGSFFFSVHTFATIGYGSIAPMSLGANLLVTLESLVGLLGFALATGVVFARFARPVAYVIFSRSALIAPYRGGTGFMFRMVNGRSNQLIELRAKVSVNLSRNGKREFHELGLERDQVTLLPLAWTVVHPIDESSPLSGMSWEQIEAADPEFFVVLTGLDETFAQQVHARRSYRTSELVWGARFADLFIRRPDQPIAIDVRRLHEYHPAELPAAPSTSEPMPS
jgi:inward rectifier potassium channel